MMDKIAAVPLKRLLLVGALLFLSLSLVALRAPQDVAGPPVPEPTATVLASNQAPSAGIVALRTTPVPPRASDPQPVCAASLGEPAGKSIEPGLTPTPTSLPEMPAPSATSMTMALPGAGSEYDRPERVVLGPHDMHEGWQAPTEPDLPPTPTPAPQVSQPPTRIVAQAIGLDVPVVPAGWKWVNRGNSRVAQWQVPKNKAGWHVTSALPGQVGNTVLSGHRNIYAEVFRYLPKLEPGDEITLYAGDEAYVYVVAEKHIVKELGVPASVREENAQWIASSDDVRLTLVTCAPYQAPGNTHRVIVVARPGPLQSGG